MQVGAVVVDFMDASRMNAHDEKSSRRLSIIMRRERSRHCQIIGPFAFSLNTTTSAVLVNTVDFMLPGETLLNQKHLDDIFRRARDAANLHQMHDVALPVLHALFVIRHWITRIRLPPFVTEVLCNAKTVSIDSRRLSTVTL